MSESSELQAQVLSGRLSNVKLRNATAEVFFGKTIVREWLRLEWWLLR